MTTTTPPSRAPKILLYGDTGVGKSHAIRSLVECGLEVFVLATEPGLEAVCGDIPPSKLHWRYLSAVPVKWDSFTKAATDFNTKTYEAICKGVPDRSEFRQWMDLASALVDFKDDRTGQSFGDFMSWGPERAFVFDSMSGLNILATNAWMGAKVAMDKPDYQVIQKHIADLFNRICMGPRCWVLVTAHAEREEDPITGAVRIMPSSIGRKLAPQLPRFFDEMLYAKREVVQKGAVAEARFLWSNLEPTAACKARYLPWSSTLTPDFKPLHTAWLAKNSI